MGLFIHTLVTGHSISSFHFLTIPLSAFLSFMYFMIALQVVDRSYFTTHITIDILPLLFLSFGCLVKQGKHFIWNIWNLASNAFEIRPCCQNPF